MPTEDKAASKDNVHLVLRGPDGQVKHEQTVHNLIVTAGVAAIVSRLASSPGSAVPTHGGVGTGTTAAVAGNTVLETPLSSRVALTSNTASAGVLTMVQDYAAGVSTGAITEAGIFSASTNGTMFSRAVFTVINKAAGDTLSITWTYTLTV